MGTEYDIAMLKLKHPLKLNANISKVHLPKSGSDPRGIVSVAGWGDTSLLNASEWGSRPLLKTMPTEILQTVDLKIIADNHLCQKLVNKNYHELMEELMEKALGNFWTEEAKKELKRKKILLSKTSICTIGPLIGGKGACQVI